MNPYERRIIHATVSEIAGVMSKSTGDEPFRRVVISSTVMPKRNFRSNNNTSSDKSGTQQFPRVTGPKTFSRPPKNMSDVPVRPRSDRSDRRKNDDIPLKQIEMPKSSFERDYKKPKPEDSMLGAGSLYDRLDI
jgi:spoIIIJ-associated protein